MSEIRVDFASEGCQWEADAPCPKPGAGMLESLGIYCTEHLAFWRKEIERQEERDLATAFGVGDWYRRMSQRNVPS